MGKAAVLDTGLEDAIDISQYLKPSACIESFFEISDLVYLLNMGKTVETGKKFGKMLTARVSELRQNLLSKSKARSLPMEN
jgi:hypothetical protein